MKKASIGIFDSGFGGLTVMNAVTALLPHENIAYFADTAHLPYGDKTPEQILEYSYQSICFLENLPIKLLIIACHTSSVTALIELQNRFPFPIISIAECAVEELICSPAKDHLALLATERTVASGIYQKKIFDKLPQSHVTALACPFFVPLIERGYTNHPFLTPLTVQQSLKALVQKKPSADAVLLACTHYPLLKEAIQKELGSSTLIVDPSTRCAEEVKKILLLQDLQNEEQNVPQYQFYVSSDPERFQTIGKNFSSKAIEKISCIPFNGSAMRVKTEILLN